MRALLSLPGALILTKALAAPTASTDLSETLLDREAVKTLIARGDELERRIIGRCHVFGDDCLEEKQSVAQVKRDLTRLGYTDANKILNTKRDLCAEQLDSLKKRRDYAEGIDTEKRDARYKFHKPVFHSCYDVDLDQLDDADEETKKMKRDCAEELETEKRGAKKRAPNAGKHIFNPNFCYGLDLDDLLKDDKDILAARQALPIEESDEGKRAHKVLGTPFWRYDADLSELEDDERVKKRDDPQADVEAKREETGVEEKQYGRVN